MKLVTEFGMEWNGTVCGIVEWGLELCCVVLCGSGVVLCCVGVGVVLLKEVCVLEANLS